MAAQPTPLQRYVIVQRKLDREMAAVLRDAAQDAEKRMAALMGKQGIGARVQRAQYALIVQELRRQQGELWGAVSGSLRQNMKRAAAQAAEAGNLMDRVLFNALGGPIPELERAFHVQAQSTVDNYIARTVNGIPLSEQVYKTQALSNGLVDKEINRAILLGESAKQLADRVKKFISPSTPGGVSYAAKRLGRTELNNAFHTAQIDRHKDAPWTEGFKWHLSGSHPRPDECNDYAESQHYKGGDVGVFRKDQIPGKPHPNCLCYTSAVNIGEEEMIQRFLSGEYNTYIDEKVYSLAPNVSPC